MVSQMPLPQTFKADPNWPKDLSDLYTEASRAFDASAFTACAMVCRKLLMATACHESADDGKPFTEYVDYIINKVLTFPKARAAIDSIRGIGNEANHNVQFVSQGDANRAMQIVTYMLNAIYSLPATPATP